MPTYRSVDWNAPVSHSSISSLQAKLSTSVGDIARLASSQGTKGSMIGVPKCNIEVWAKGYTYPDPTELAYCRGVVCPRNGCAKVQWLGRSQQRPVHEHVRSRRCVPRSFADPSGRPAKQLTVAEALLGVFAMIVERFELGNLELQAMDNGSGKLVELYRRLGFHTTAQEEKDAIWMEAPIEPISSLAPDEWHEALIPREFSGLDWMRGTVIELLTDQHLYRWQHHAPSWTVDWPAEARVEVNLMRHGLDPDSRLTASASIMASDGRELVSIRCSLALDLNILRVFWIGRSRSRPVHPSIRGCAEYETAAPEPHSKVTGAVALLGFMAALGRWFNLVTADMQVADDGSGRLVEYLSGVGFAKKANAPDDRKYTWMETPCDALARRCAPLAWYDPSGLPADGACLAELVVQESQACPEPADRERPAPASPPRSPRAAGSKAVPSPAPSAAAAPAPPASPPTPVPVPWGAEPAGRGCLAPVGREAEAPAQARGARAAPRRRATPEAAAGAQLPQPPPAAPSPPPPPRGPSPALPLPQAARACAQGDAPAACQAQAPAEGAWGEREAPGGGAAAGAAPGEVSARLPSIAVSPWPSGLGPARPVSGEQAAERAGAQGQRPACKASARSDAESTPIEREAAESTSAQSTALPSLSPDSADASGTDTSPASLDAGRSNTPGSGTSPVVRRKSTPEKEASRRPTKELVAGGMLVMGARQVDYPKKPGPPFEGSPKKRGQSRHDPLEDLKELLRRREEALMC